jgi:hypothetical protein
VNVQLVFDSLDDFHLADVRRWTSQRADYGVMWREGTGSRFHPPSWRVSYVRATGEVYAVSTAGPVRILGVVPADGEGSWSGTLDAVLGNWADPMANDGFSLAWLEGRLRDAARAVCEGSCPLGYAPGLPSPCRVSGKCMRPTDTSHV